MTSRPPNSRRLIEDWLPINEISIESIRERAGSPRQTQLLTRLHVWWARRPLATRAGPPSLHHCCRAHQHLQSSTGSWGHTRELWTSSRISTRPRSKAIRIEQGFSKPRAFTHNLSEDRAGVVEPEPGHREPKWCWTSPQAAGQYRSRQGASGSEPSPTS